MSDLIDRQAAIDKVDRIVKVNHLNPDMVWFTPNGVKTLMEDLPSAQPEIIQCYECKWFQCNMRPDGYVPKGVDAFECRHWCGSCDPVDFCSYAERREE